MTAIASAERADLAWSFVDLKSWALEAVADPPAGDPFIAGRRALHLDDGPVTAGALRLRPGHGQVAGQAADEFLHVVAGALALEVGTHAFELEAGQSLAIPPGTSFGWRCSQPTVLIYVRHATSAAGSPKPCAMDSTTERKPSNLPDMKFVISLLSNWFRRVELPLRKRWPRPVEPAQDTERRLVRKLEAHFGRRGPTA